MSFIIGTETVAKRRSVLSFTKANSRFSCRQWKRRLQPKGTFHVQLQQSLKRKPSNSLSGLKTLIAFIPLTCSTRPCSPLTCWSGSRRRRALIASWQCNGRGLGWKWGGNDGAIRVTRRTRRGIFPSTMPSTSSPMTNLILGWLDTVFTDYDSAKIYENIHMIRPNCKSLPFFLFSNIRKGRLLYIRPVG